MIELFRRNSLGITAVVLLIVSAQLMSASVANRELPQYGAGLIKTVIAPIEQVYHESLESVRFTWNRYLWLMDVEKERNEFQSRVKELEKSNSAFIEVAKENERLRELLGFKDDTGLKGTVAQVIGRSTSNWIHTITIDRGADDGIASGMAVVDGHGLVGQTTAVSSNSAQILIVTDSNSAVDTVIQRTRATGIVEGQLGKRLRLRYALRQDDIQVGDRIVSSGLDGVFPKGLVLGTVISLQKEAQGLFQTAKVKPAVDFNRLETVMVLMKNQAPIEKENPIAQAIAAEQVTAVVKPKVSGE